jgi:hypothetical protein
MPPNVVLRAPAEYRNTTGLLKANRGSEPYHSMKSSMANAYAWTVRRCERVQDASLGEACVALKKFSAEIDCQEHRNATAYLPPCHEAVC